MTTCVDCRAATAALRGSGPYSRRDLCGGCYMDWYERTTRAQARIAAALAFQAPPAPADAPPAAMPDDTPTWKRGRNVVVREKPCDRCGVLIHIRKGPDGHHYPAEHGTTQPHWRVCAKRRSQ